jgi:hypothetical protein
LLVPATLLALAMLLVVVVACASDIARARRIARTCELLIQMHIAGLKEREMFIIPCSLSHP